jgi:hypothetical protein
VGGTTEEVAGKTRSAAPAPKGASEFEALTASLKRCPDTKLEFLSKLFSLALPHAGKDMSVVIMRE